MGWQPKARLEITPTEGPPGTVIGISGTSRCAVAFVQVTFRDQTGEVMDSETGFTDADGNIIASVTAAGEPGPAVVHAEISNPITDCADLGEAAFTLVEAPATETPTASPTGSLTPTPTFTETGTPSPSPTGSRSPTTTSPSPSSTAPAVPSETPADTNSPTPTVSPTPTPTFSPTATQSLTPTLSPTPQPSDTPVPPSDTPVPPSLTPVPPSDTPVPPSLTPVPPSDTAVPPVVPSTPTSTRTSPPTPPGVVTTDPVTAEPTVAVLSSPAVQTVVPPSCEQAGDCPPSPGPLPGDAGAEVVPLTGTSASPEHCFVEEFSNPTGERANGLYVTLRGPLELTQAYVGSRNPFGPPESTSGFNPQDSTYRLDYRGAEIEPGGTVAVGACARVPRLGFSPREGLPSHFFSWGISPLVGGDVPPSLGFSVEWFTGGERVGTPAGAFILDVFGPWLGQAAAQDVPTARLLLFNTSEDPGSDQLLVSGLQVASLMRAPAIDELGWESTDDLGWRSASQSDVLVKRGSVLSVDVRLAPGQSLAWRGLAVYVGAGPDSTTKVVGVVSPAQPTTGTGMWASALTLLVAGLASGALGVFFLIRALRPEFWEE